MFIRSFRGTGFRAAGLRAFIAGLFAVAAGVCAAAQQPAAPADVQPDAPMRYEGHKIVRVHLENAEDLAQMLEVSQDFWSCSPHLGIAPFRVPPERMAALDATGLMYEVAVDDIQPMLDAERAGIGQRGGWFSGYRTYAEVNAYMTSLVALRPDLATSINLGNSINGNAIMGLQITGAGGTAGKPGLLFNACLHAREWVSVTVPMYLADQFVRNYDTDAAVRDLLDRAVIFVVPISNPDGYLYTWSTQRLWRKNRRNNGDGTFGVDNNRNWGYQWGLDSGSSGSTSSETYRGTAPFSEPETQVLRNFFQAHPELVGHIDFHCFSQLILSPYGYDEVEPPGAEGARFNTLNQLMHDAILGVHGESYAFGPIGSSLYLASGGSVDWVYGDQGVYSWTIELRPDENDPAQFILPADQIIPTCEEAYAGTMAMAQYLTSPFSFAFPGGQPSIVPAGASYELLVDINPGTGAVQAGSQLLFSRIGTSGAFASSPLVSLGGNSYRATLPAAACDAVVQYYVQATSTASQTLTSPSDAPAGVYSALAQQTSVIFSDDMESNQGWTAGQPGDTATTGIWTRVNPNGTAAQPEDDHTAVPGATCWVTGQGTAGGGVGDADVDGGFTSLVSPAIALPAGSDPVVSYWRWYSNDAGASPNQDVFRVSISADGGPWVSVETVGPTGSEVSGGWLRHEFRAADFVSIPSSIRVRFVAEDANPGSIVEAAVDDFSVVEIGCPDVACPGDANDDGARDLSDLSILLAAFGTQTGNPGFNPQADFNDDGRVDLTDLSTMLGVFGTPCP